MRDLPWGGEIEMRDLPCCCHKLLVGDAAGTGGPVHDPRLEAQQDGADHLEGHFRHVLIDTALVLRQVRRAAGQDFGDMGEIRLGRSRR